MSVVYKRAKCLTPVEFTYCPGCGHGIATNLIAKVIDELGSSRIPYPCPPWGAAA